MDDPSLSLDIQMRLLLSRFDYRQRISPGLERKMTRAIDGTELVQGQGEEGEGMVVMVVVQAGRSQVLLAVTCRIGQPEAWITGVTPAGRVGGVCGRWETCRQTETNVYY